MGSEVYIDMYNDRLEITSLGGMHSGGNNIQDQDITNIRSNRRNPTLSFFAFKNLTLRGFNLSNFPLFC